MDGLSALHILLISLCVALTLWAWHSRRRLRVLEAERSRLIEQNQARAQELHDRNEQLLELNQRLQEASITDPLTGLLNRRSFFEFVSREIARIERDYTSAQGDGRLTLDGEPLPGGTRALFFMMLDLDAFKPINDSHGHTAGDQTLVQVAALLRACAREADTVFRWGGDEFLIIGQVARPADMELLAERLRRSIAEHRFDPVDGKALRLTASIGVAAYPFVPDQPGLVSWEQVADIADRCAYIAKAHGKDAWVCARGASTLSAADVAELTEELEALIDRGRIAAVTSKLAIPLSGARGDRH